jgi:Arc/MetJ-type ribon-helix-helix transcriptional regulator
MTITLPPALDRIVREKVNSGLYASESDPVCEALRHEFSGDAVQMWIRERAAEGFAQLDEGDAVEVPREKLDALCSRV